MSTRPIPSSPGAAPADLDDVASTPPARPSALAAYYFASFSALGVFLPYWPRWLDARGVTGPALGVVAAVVPAVAVFAPLVTGAVADALRLRAAILRVACATSLVAFAAIAGAGAGPLADGAGPAGVVFLVVATAVFALARSPMVLVADVITLEQTRGSGEYGALRRFGSLGFLAAATATSWWAPLGHPYAVPALVAAASGAALLASLRLPARARPMPRPDRAGVLAFVRRPGVPSFLVAIALLHAAHASYDLTFTLHLRDVRMPDRWVGATWGVGVAAEIALFSVIGRGAKRTFDLTLVSIAALGGAARWAILATGVGPLATALLQPLHAVSFGCMWLGATSFVARRAAPGELASAQGTFSACAAVGHAAGMMAWATLHASRGGRTVFTLAALIAALAAVPALASRRVRA